MLWVILANAYSTARRNPPFGRAGNPAVLLELEEALDDESDGKAIGRRVIRNQILTRSAGPAGRAITALGAAAVAGGIALQRKPVTPKKTEFSWNTKAEARYQMRQRKGTHMYYKYGDTYDDAYWRRTTHLKKYAWSPQPDTQHKRFLERKNVKQKRNVRRGAVLRGAGAGMMVAGKALPVIVYGYIGYDLYQRNATRQEYIDEFERATFGMTTEERHETGQMMYRDAMMYYAVADTMYNIMSPLAFEILF